MKIRIDPRGYSLVELLVALAIIVILAALLATVLARAQEKGHAAQCLASMRQIGVASLLHASDNGGALPGSSHGGKSWTKSLEAYLSGTTKYRCASDKNPTRARSYCINDFLLRYPDGAPWLDFSLLQSVEQPASTAFLCEAADGYTGADHFHFSYYQGVPISREALSADVAVERHMGAANYLFVDGHAEPIAVKSAEAKAGNPGSKLIDPTR